MSDRHVPEQPGLPVSARANAGRLPHSEVERLLRLMGGMLADSYVDACDLLVEHPRHRTTTHLVAHLAREIDSGLRSLLMAMLPADRQQYLQSLLEDHPDLRDPPRRNVIEEICTFLGIPETSDIAVTWKRLGWAGRAHRNALRIPRTVDRILLQDWDDLVRIIETIGQGFEASYLSTLPLVDQLAKTDSPTKDDCKSLREKVPQSTVSLQRFFASAGPAWFPLLRRAHYFEDAETLLPDDEGMLSYIPWPPGPYLVRIATESALADQVVAVFEALNTNNPQAAECAAEIALAVSTDRAVRLAPKIAEFLQHPGLWRLPFTAAEVVVRLAAEDRADAALIIVDALVPVPSRGSNRSRLVAFDQISPAYAKLGPGIVRVLADRLHAADQDPGNGIHLKYSRTWRPTIANDRHDNGRDELVTALRDAAIAVADTVGAAPVVELLGQYEAEFFSRIALHVLRHSPTPDLVSQWLTSATAFSSLELYEEYTLLLQQEFPRLQSGTQQSIMDLIEAGPSTDHGRSDPIRWRFWQMVRLGDSLPEVYHTEFQDLLEQYGPVPAYDPGSDESYVRRPDLKSPADAAALTSMSNEELVSLLETWTQPAGWDGPTVEGLCLQLAQAIASEPLRFSLLGPRFTELKPAYCHTLLSTLEQVVGAEQPTEPADNTDTHHERLAWTELLACAQTIANSPQEVASTDDRPDEDGALLRRDVAKLLAAAMHTESIDRSRQPRILALLLTLGDDPDPNISEDYSSPRYDPISRALSTVRPLAIEAMMQFMAWVGRTDPQSQAALESVTALLDAHLDPAQDGSPAVRSVYGRYFWAVLSVIPEWTRANHDRIFGTTDGMGLGAVAWQSFLRTNRPSLATYELLSDKYAAAVAELPGQPTDAEPLVPEAEAIDRLLCHIAVLYARGIIALDGEIITVLFSADIPIEFRARTLEACGQILASSHSPSVELMSRLQGLWDWREAELVAGHTDPNELISAGWWASSTSLPTAWLLQKLQNLLLAGGIPEPTHYVLDRLATLTTTHTRQTVHCLSLLIDAPTDRWLIDRCHEQINAILTAGVNSSESLTHREAKDIINRLVARGRTTFEKILDTHR